MLFLRGELGCLLSLLLLILNFLVLVDQREFRSVLEIPNSIFNRCVLLNLFVSVLASPPLFVVLGLQGHNLQLCVFVKGRRVVADFIHNHVKTVQTSQLELELETALS